MWSRPQASYLAPHTILLGSMKWSGKQHYYTKGIRNVIVKSSFHHLGSSPIFTTEVSPYSEEGLSTPELNPSLSPPMSLLASTSKGHATEVVITHTHGLRGIKPMFNDGSVVYNCKPPTPQLEPVQRGRFGRRNSH